MGLPDDYILPDNSIACHLTGDGVVGPAVRFLADALIELVVLRNRGAGKLTARETSRRRQPLRFSGIRKGPGPRGRTGS